MAKGVRASTIGELKQSGYKVLPTRAELRKNLIQRIKSKGELFPGIIGYEDTVIPQIQNALLAGQDIIFLGERGQAKSRLIRSLTALLDDQIPIVEGCEINDNPYDPICKACREKVARSGDHTPIAWIAPEDRYAEKLATPDITVADLIGEIDPIRVAEGRYLSDELVIHYGLIPRTNRGIFCINELPDLAERIQVGLFNLMEERDIQIKGYRVRLPLDVYVVASANPEDYTNRGRIITPLKDRYGAQIRTHYPRSLDQEITIVEQERTRFDELGNIVLVPPYMREIIAEITSLARRSPDINQRSGVSVRVSIANMETVIANAYRRATMLGEDKAAPRISDLAYILPSTTGKIELETVEEGREGRILEELTKKALLNVFGRYFAISDFTAFLKPFEEGQTVEASDMLPISHYLEVAKNYPALSQPVKRLGAGEHPATVASAVEFILEGLHLNRRLNRERVEGRYRYRS